MIKRIYGCGCLHDPYKCLGLFQDTIEYYCDKCGTRFMLNHDLTSKVSHSLYSNLVCPICFVIKQSEDYDK